MNTDNSSTKPRLLIKPKTFSQLVLTWFKQHGRKDLPWQHNPTPYRVWISEIMLQQTQVNTVIPYYLKFMETFPTLQALSSATNDQVMALWSGLGYYSRARNLHKTALELSNNNPSLPDSLDALVALPGIGRSTAGAILSLSMNKKAAILDGNVKRVLARHFQVSGWPGNSAVLKELWQLSEFLTPQKSVNQYNQAMMDLGATLCTRSKPSCSVCPLINSCLAYKHSNQADYPGKKKKKVLPIKHQNFYLLMNDANELLMEKRPATGIWGGLWTPPSSDIDLEIESYLSEQLNIEVSSTEMLPEFRHTFSHFHLQISPIKASFSKFNGTNESGLRWDSIENWLDQGIPAAVRAMLNSIKGEN
ncbi:MAG: A/G-specific adenine glycosylase [Enterobacterales bacterium]